MAMLILGITIWILFVIIMLLILFRIPSYWAWLWTGGVSMANGKVAEVGWICMYLFLRLDDLV